MMRSSSPLLLPAEMWADIEAAYQTPPRAYHGISHISEVVQHYHQVAATSAWQNPKEVYLAVLYHDAIYRAGRKDNESLSADMAVQAIARYLPNEKIDAALVRRLIELTAKHGHLQPDGLDSDTQLFLDCDMAILGSESDQFLVYDKAIAMEYRGKMPAWLFSFYRRKFLRGLLESPRIFLSELFFQSHEAKARANIEALVKKPRNPLVSSSGR